MSVALTLRYASFRLDAITRLSYPVIKKGFPFQYRLPYISAGKLIMISQNATAYVIGIGSTFSSRP